MRVTAGDDPEGPWIALLCVGILLTTLAATLCLAVIALYTLTFEDVEPILVCFAAGAVLMMAAAARLEYLSVVQTRADRR